MKKIGCVQHDCDECKGREVDKVSMGPVAFKWKRKSADLWLHCPLEDMADFRALDHAKVDIELLYSAAQLASVQAELDWLNNAVCVANNDSEYFRKKYETLFALEPIHHDDWYAQCNELAKVTQERDDLLDVMRRSRSICMGASTMKLLDNALTKYEVKG